jgi:hypothetical protein
MKRWTAILIFALVAVASAGIAAAQPATDEHAALRTRLEQRFDMVPLTEGVALKPKTAVGDVRLIEITDEAILVNGVAVTGRELRDRLGADADIVLKLSYLDPESRRALMTATEKALVDEPVEALHRRAACGSQKHEAIDV